MYKWVILGVIAVLIIGVALWECAFEEGWSDGYANGIAKGIEIRKENKDGKERKEESA